MIMMDWIASGVVALLMAQATSTEPVTEVDVMRWNFMLRQLVAAVVFSLVGVAVMALCVWIIDQLTPFSFRKEVLQEHNTALAIVIGAAMLGIAIIIAAAIHG
jgi:hypothetical protein